MPAVFISYSRRDKAFVQRLHEAFSARGYEVWVDWEDIPLTARWRDEIRAGIINADGVIYVISPDSVASEVCGHELEHAILQHKRIVPVVHRDPGTATVPQAAAEVNWVFLRDEDDFDAGFELLVAALETDLDYVRAHTRIGVDAERWDAGGRDRSQLLRGAELVGAEAWLVEAGDKQPQPTQLHREYLLASRQAATRRQRVILGAVSLALLVAVALGIVALIQRSDAIHNEQAANAALLDTEAVSDYASDPQQSVSLAVKGVNTAKNASTQEALRAALAQTHLIRRLTGATSVVPDALWSPDGTRLLVTSPGLSAKIFRPGSDAPALALPPPPTSGEVAWDGAGNRIVIGGPHPAVYDAGTGRLLARLAGNAVEVALSSDGTRAATVDSDGVGHVFDVAGGSQLASFHPAFRGGVTCFAWAPDGSLIAQCDAQSTTNSDAPASLDLWNPSTGRLVRADRTTHLIGTVAFSPDSTRYAFTTTITPPIEPTVAQQIKADEVAAGDPGTFVYNTRTGALEKTFGGGASAATFSPDSTKLAYATLDGIGHVYNFVSGLDEPLRAATGAIESISFDSASVYVVTGSDDGASRVYDASDGALLETLTDGATGAVDDASFGFHDTMIATASADGVARLWTAPQLEPAARVSLLGGLAGPAVAAFTANGGRIVEAGVGPSAGGSGEILDARGLRPVARFSAPPGYHFVGAASSRDGSLIATIAYRDVDNRFVDGLVETVDARSGRLLARISAPAGESVSYASMAPTGDRLVTLYGDDDAQQWDPRTGARLELLRGSTHAVLAGYSPNGSILAVVHYPLVPAALGITQVLGYVTIDLFDARTGRFLRELRGPHLTPLIPGVVGFAPPAIAFSANSKAIALVGADQYVWGWPTESAGAPIQIPVPDNSFAVSVAFSPNGQLLAAGTASAAYVWTLRTLSNEVFQHAPPSEFTIQAGFGVNVAFAHGSQILVTVGDWALEAWNIADDLRLFDVPIFYGHGSLNPAGTEFVAAQDRGLAVYPCTLCGGLSQLMAAARRVPAGD